MSTSENVLTRLPGTTRPATARRLDSGFLAGLAISAAALTAGIASSGVGLRFFFQPAGALVVVGGTLGVIFLTTPVASLGSAARRVKALFSSEPVDREALIEQIVAYAREARQTVLAKLEPAIRSSGQGFLQEGLLLAMDARSREELRTVLESETRVRERHAEADARVLEVAGGFAPTLGILGTVIGLADVLRQFSDTQAVGFGIGMAFISTLYGLGLANLLLLPAAHRIRARALQEFELNELTTEGVLCVFDRTHPYLIRQRLRVFLRKEERKSLES